MRSAPAILPGFAEDLVDVDDELHGYRVHHEGLEGEGRGEPLASEGQQADRDEALGGG